MLKRFCSLFLAFVILFCSAIGGTGIALANAGGSEEATYEDVVLDTLRPDTEGGAGGPQNDEKRYLIFFDETTDVGATWVTGYVDGAETGTENAAVIMMLGRRVKTGGRGCKTKRQFLLDGKAVKRLGKV